ncbi:monooxygenase [Salimicrobium salexigens]|uniref:Mono-oxygenase ydhR n=1 Tax=Salimicrobium salexigens TaxID=908941 RepID=A0ABY1KVG2_9BACI|nr:monooxygenase [Salimicrobium salexigens]SIS83037.1 Putative mono-oxygenase ydhR [Salimicrobium salexigens]
MTTILQMDFAMDGPFGDEMADQFKELAESINEEEGFKWKIWTENPETKEAGGIYAFDSEDAAKKYLDKHSKRLKGFGIRDVNAKIFEVNEKLTEITFGTKI